MTLAAGVWLLSVWPWRASALYGSTRKDTHLPIHITLEDEQRAVSALADFFRTAVLPDIQDQRCCVLAARLATKALDRVGIPNLHRHVDATCFNDELLYHLTAGTTPEDVPMSAWSIAVWSDHEERFPTHPSNGFSGHLIVETENYFIDLSSRQFDRSEHNITTGGPLVMPLSKLTEVRQTFARPGSWNVPIKSGHYWFNDAVNPLEPTGLSSWRYGYREFLPKCVKAIRRAMYSEPPVALAQLKGVQNKKATSWCWAPSVAEMKSTDSKEIHEFEALGLNGPRFAFHRLQGKHR